MAERTMLVWLAEQRVLEWAGAEDDRRGLLESLRLRAMVALHLWVGMSPSELARWSMRDFEALAWDEDCSVWNAWHSLFVWLPSRMADGPKAVVSDWIAAAHIGEGRVFRRINPHGVVTERSLDEVGIASLLNGLVREGEGMGVINRQYAFDFSRRDGFVQPTLAAQRSLVRPMPESGTDEQRAARTAGQQVVAPHVSTTEATRGD